MRSEDVEEQINHENAENTERTKAEGKSKTGFQTMILLLCLSLCVSVSSAVESSSAAAPPVWFSYDPPARQARRVPLLQGRAGGPVRRVAAVDALRHQRQRQVEHLRRRHLRPVRPPPRRQPERRRTHQQGVDHPRRRVRLHPRRRNCYRIKRTLRRKKRRPPAPQQSVPDPRPRRGRRRTDWEPVAGHQPEGRVRQLGPATRSASTTRRSRRRCCSSRARPRSCSTPRPAAGPGCWPASWTWSATRSSTAGRTSSGRPTRAGLETFANQLAAVPEVGDDEYASAGVRIEEAEAARHRRAGAHRRCLHAVELQARNWAETQARLAATREKLRHAESLLGHAVAIEKEFARLARTAGRAAGRRHHRRRARPGRRVGAQDGGVPPRAGRETGRPPAAGRERGRDRPGRSSKA